MASLLDNMSIAWSGDFDSLNKFTSDELNLNGNWEHPGDMITPLLHGERAKACWILKAWMRVRLLIFCVPSCVKTLILQTKFQIKITQTVHARLTLLFRNPAIANVQMFVLVFMNLSLAKIPIVRLSKQYLTLSSILLKLWLNFERILIKVGKTIELKTTQILFKN